MQIDLLKALLLLVKYCAQRENCSKCELKPFCGK